MLTNEREFFHEREKALTTKMLRQGLVILDPEPKYAEDDQSFEAKQDRLLIQELQNLNSYIENLDRGRNSGLKLTVDQDPDALRKYARVKKEAKTDRPMDWARFQQEFPQQSHDTQREWIESYPWLYSRWMSVAV